MHFVFQAEDGIRNLVRSRVLGDVYKGQVLIPSHSGGTAQRLTRLRLTIWIAAVASQDATCQALQFSYGVHPILEAENKHNWTEYAREWVKSQSLSGDFVILIEGPSPRNPRANHKLEIVDVK